MPWKFRSVRADVALVLPVLICSGCLGRDRLANATEPPPSLTTAMPRLVPVLTTTTIDASPSSVYAAIRVGPQGDLLLSGQTADGELLRLVDSTGRVRHAFGRLGEGPGEVRSPVPIGVTDSSVLAFDLRTLRVSEWDTAGRFLETHRTGTTVIPELEVPGRGWIAAGDDEGSSPVLLDRVHWTPKHLLAHDDSAYRALRPPRGDAAAVMPPVLGAWSGGFVVGNGASYRLALYDWHGTLRHLLTRDLPPNLPSAGYLDHQAAMLATSVGPRGQRPSPADLARLRSSRARQPREWFNHVSPIGMDGRGRIWIAGPEGDSAFVDVFNAEQFLGRIHLPCADFNYRWSMQGSWLAMVCAPDDPAFAGDAVVKLFRLEEPVATAPAR